MIDRVDHGGEGPPQHWSSSWLKVAGIGATFVVLYVASIGPLAGLESHGYGNRSFWATLKPAYFPIYWSWKHGPQWLADAFRDYVKLFHAPEGTGFGLRLHYFGSLNDAELHRMKR